MITNTHAISTPETPVRPSFTPRESGVRIPYRPLDLRQKSGNPDTASDTAPRNGFGPLWIVDATTGCWIWQRSLDKDGYGYFRSLGKIVRAHRHYFELKHGKIPLGLLPDHEMRQLRADGATYAAVADKFGVGISLTAQILTGRCWKEVSDSPAIRLREGGGA